MHMFTIFLETTNFEKRVVGDKYISSKYFYESWFHFTTKNLKIEKIEFF